jgi:hypothetical protein
VSSTDHYRAAEYLLEEKRSGVAPRSSQRPPDLGSKPPTAEEVVQAQAHATLALVDVAEKLLAELVTLRQHLSGS